MGLCLREKQQGAGALYGGGVKVGNGTAHHGTAADHLHCIGRDTAQIIKDIAQGRTYAHEEVSLVGEALARDGDGVVHDGLVLLHGVVHSQGGCHVLHNGSYADGQGAGTNLTVHHSVDELLFTALRVAHLHHHHLNAFVAKFGNDLTDVGNGLRLVLFNGDGARDIAHHLPEDGSANHHLLSLFKESAEARCEVRLTLTAVYDNPLTLGSGRRGKFHMRREGCSAKADDATQTNLLDGGLVVLRQSGDKGV